MTELHRISPSDVEAASRALISARKTNLGIEVQMPLIYPTGDSVTVVVTVQGGDYLVHDAGFGAMYLTTAGVTMSRGLHTRLADLARHYGCEFIDGRMSRRCSPEQIALAMVMVANASRTVGDQMLDAKKRPMAIFKREITEVVSEVYGSRVREDEAIKSAMGTTYKINALILDKDERSPVAFVEAVTDEQAVNRHFREFYDLEQTPEYANVTRLAIYDDRRRWRIGDVALLEKVGRVLAYRDASKSLRAIAA